MSMAEPRYKAIYTDTVAGRMPNVVRVRLLAVTAGVLMCIGSVVILALGLVTALQARRLYAACATALSRMILWLYGVDLQIHGAPPWPSGQHVYVSNHTSTLDVFVLVALGLPNTRFFLSGFLRKIVPLGIISTMMGTFFTVAQSRPDERRRIFANAARVLRRTGESVYLSPEGERVTTGQIGHFNKGAFHLATDLRAPIVPMFIHIPPEVDPKRGLDARPGMVHVHVLPTITTRDWTIDDVPANAERVRDIFIRFQLEREPLECL
jgi:1-acyl-sn-glycerol-3-phosphate acyltransferase